jgi:hypothetical protein
MLLYQVALTLHGLEHWQQHPHGVLELAQVLLHLVQGCPASEHFVTICGRENERVTPSIEQFKNFVTGH